MVKKYFQVPELILGFDTETTGLSVASERAISYGFCAYRFGVPVWSEQFFVIPDRPISAGAYRVHHLSLEDLEAKRESHAVHDVEGRRGARHVCPSPFPRARGLRRGIERQSI